MDAWGDSGREEHRSQWVIIQSEGGEEWQAKTCNTRHIWKMSITTEKDLRE